MNSIKNSISKDSFFGSLLFFLVLSSWYTLRPVRNEMAVANVDELPYLLAAGALAMLIINPIYSWIASRSNLKKIILSKKLQKIDFVSKGDDYQILFTASKKKSRIIKTTSKSLGIKISKIGSISSGAQKSQIIDEKGNKIAIKNKGHFHNF